MEIDISGGQWRQQVSAFDGGDGQMWALAFYGGNGRQRWRIETSFNGGSDGGV